MRQIVNKSFIYILIHLWGRGRNCLQSICYRHLSLLLFYLFLCLRVHIKRPCKYRIYIGSWRISGPTAACKHSSTWTRGYNSSSWGDRRASEGNTCRTLLLLREVPPQTLRPWNSVELVLSQLNFHGGMEINMAADTEWGDPRAAEALRQSCVEALGDVVCLCSVCTWHDSFL